MVCKALSSQRRACLVSVVVAVLVCLAVANVALAVNVYQLCKSVPATVNILPASALLPGDVTRDGTIDVADLALVASAFNTTPGAPNWNPSSDLNEDGVVDIFDLVVVGKNYGRSVQ